MNSLLYEHQLAILRAQHSANGAGDCDLHDHVNFRALRIADWRTTQGLQTIGWPGHDEALDRDRKLSEPFQNIEKATIS
ncbi:MAG: hypothetical protein WBA68_12405 [Alteraurantiacibacter sp.]